MSRALKPRDLVIDNHGRTGIVVERTRKPSRKWIMEQIDTSVRGVGECAWWKVMPLSGGLVIVPEPEAKYQREATTDDALEAVAGGNAAALRRRYPAKTLS